MTDEPAPDHEPGHGPDDPDLEHPLTADDIINQASASLSGEGRSASDTQAGRLVALALARFRLVQGDDGRLYAVAHDGPAIAYSLRGTHGLRGVLADLYYDLHGQPAGGSAMTDALAVIEARAARAEREPVALRVGSTGPRALALDLGTPDGRCVLVDGTGWRLIDRPPVLLRRSVLTGPLPVPTRAGSLDPLAELLNVDEAGFRLIVGWLVAALVQEIPHPILALVGEQGTAKSTAARLVVSLIDPSPAPLRTPPREMRSWAAAASASWIVALDNVSTIPPWLSDTLCKAVTGDGIVERALHTDDDLNILAFRRCVALTSIDAGKLSGDLAERLVTVELDVIAPERRRPDAEVANAYEREQPGLLGALLDLVVQVLAELPRVQLAELPRMADFARILGALDATQGWSTLTDYLRAAEDAGRAVLDGDPVADAVIALVDEHGSWAGTAGELLARITPDPRPPGWPRTPQVVSGTLKRLAPALRASGGLVVEFPPRGQTRTIVLRAATTSAVKGVNSSSRSSRSSRDPGDLQ
jgi:hypothetical protein